MSEKDALSPRHRMIQGNLQQLFKEDSEEALPDRFQEMIARLRASGPDPAASGTPLGAAEKDDVEDNA